LPPAKAVAELSQSLNTVVQNFLKVGGGEESTMAAMAKHAADRAIVTSLMKSDLESTLRELTESNNESIAPSSVG
jgi:hypothetical protein